MDAATYVPLLSGLAGALMGAGASLLGVWITAREQGKRDRIAQAYTAAIEEHRAAVEYAKSHGGVKLPLFLFIYHHHEMARLMEDDALTLESYQRLMEKEHEMANALEDPRRQ